GAIHPSLPVVASKEDERQWRFLDDLAVFSEVRAAGLDGELCHRSLCEGARVQLACRNRFRDECDEQQDSAEHDVSPSSPQQAASACAAGRVRRQNQIRSRFLDVSEGRWILPGLMLRFGLLLLAAVRAAFLARTDLVVENLALRHQLSTFVHCGRRPRVGVADRVFWVTLRRVWVRWSEVLLFVQPETVVRWHRAGFRKYWTWLSQHHRREGRPSIGEDLRALILRMAAENPTWGAPRIHGELRMLGIEVSERTVSRYLPRRR